jgi:hypothetical protein
MNEHDLNIHHHGTRTGQQKSRLQRDGFPERISLTRLVGLPRFRLLVIVRLVGIAWVGHGRFLLG